MRITPLGNVFESSSVQAAGIVPLSNKHSRTEYQVQNPEY